MIDFTALGFIPNDKDTEYAIWDYGQDVENLIKANRDIICDNLEYLKEQHDKMGAFLIKLGERKAA